MTTSQGHNRRSSSPPRRQRACQPCSKAKARCNYPDNDLASGCDRCRRVMISCVPQTTKFIRRPRQLKPDSSRPSSVEPNVTSPSMETYSDPPVSSSDSYEPNGGGIMSATTPIMMPSNYDDNDQSLSQPYYQNMYHQPVQQYFPMPEMMPQSLYQDGTQNYINSSYPRSHDTTTWVQTNQMVMPFSSAPYEFGMPYATTNQDFLYCAQNP